MSSGRLKPLPLICQSSSHSRDPDSLTFYLRFQKVKPVRLARVLTSPEKDPQDGLRTRAETDGDWHAYAVPAFWSRAAGETLIAKVFHKDPIPALTKKVPEDGVPEWLWPSVPDDMAMEALSSGERSRYERDIRDVLLRVAGGLCYRGWKRGLFLDEAEARVFYDELRWILLNRAGVLETALLSGAGLGWAYGVKETPYAPRQHAQSPVQAERADSGNFIAQARQKDIDAAALELGRKMLSQATAHVLGAYAEGPQETAAAVEAARAAGVPDTFIALAISYAKQGIPEIDFFPEAEAEEGAPADKKTLSVPDAFVECALTGHGFMTYADGKPLRHANAARLLDKLAEGLWQSGAPGVLFRDACDALSLEAGEVASSPSGGFVFAQGEKAPAGVIDIAAFSDRENLIDATRAAGAVEVMTFALDIAAEDTPWRPLSLGITNVAGFLMRHGLAYDSEEGRAAAGLAAAVVSGAAHRASAMMAKRLGAFPRYAAAEKAVLQSVKDKMAFLSGGGMALRGVAARRPALKTSFFPALSQAARKIWDEAYLCVRENGLRNAHLCAADTADDEQALLAAATRDISPERTLVRFEGYFGASADGAEIYAKNLNPAVPQALARLGYGPSEMDAIFFHAVGHGTLFDAPHINHAALKTKGFHQGALDALEAALKSAHHIRYAFNKWTLGADFCLHMLGFEDAVTDDPAFDMLEALGFSPGEIEEANLYCCGKMTLDGAPHLQARHLAVFDCAPAPSVASRRRVAPAAQIKMQAAVEPFLSGAAAQTIELDPDATIDDVRKLFLAAWENGARGIRVYRHGSSLLHPLPVPLNFEPSLENEGPEAEIPADKTALAS